MDIVYNLGYLFGVGIGLALVAGAFWLVVWILIKTYQLIKKQITG